MSKTSRPPTIADGFNELAAKDQEAMDAYRRQVQTMAKEQLRALGESLTRYAADELALTESAIRADHRKTARMLAALWFRTAMIGLGVFTAIWSGLWAMGRWQQSQIEENIDLLLHLDQQIEERRQTLRELNQE